jgi:hypothetical protein
MPQATQQLLETHQQVQALVSAGDLDAAVQLTEQWVTVTDRALALEWLVQCRVRRDGVPAALAAVEQNLQRPELPGPVRGCLSAIVAMYRLPVLPFGSWASRSLTPDELSALELAEVGMRLSAPDVRWAPCALAVARALQGRGDEARSLAQQVLSRPTGPVEERGWMIAVLGMCDGDPAHLDELRRLDPGNRLLPALEASVRH